MAVIGIDLGTTNSLAVVYRNGNVELIPNQFHEYLTPSVVSLDHNELIVGKIAKERLVTDPEHTTYLFKRKMGKSEKTQLGSKSYLPEELSACVVKQLIEDAQNYLGAKVDEVVISVPAYFDATQRRATKAIGEILGVKVNRLINEPSAAAIACHQSDDFETFVVFDFGGGTLDVSVVDCFENVVSINAIAGNNQLGGSDFDKAIAYYFCQQNDIDFVSLSKEEQRSLLLCSERAKLSLQDSSSTTMKLTLSKHQYVCELDNEILFSITKHIFTEIKKVIGKAVKDSGFSAEELDSLILVGGSSYMPVVRDYLTQLLNIPVSQSEDIDLLVARGLGKYIGIKQREADVKDLLVTDICPFSLSTGVHNPIDTAKDLAEVIIPRNTVLPASESVTLQTVKKGQTHVNVTVYQGEEMYAKDNLFLGSVDIQVPRNFKEHEQFQVTYSYDINSMLYVEIDILSTQEHFTYQIGQTQRLEKVTKYNHLNAVKNVSLQLNQNPEYDALMEKAKRIFTELDPVTKDYYQATLQQFIVHFKHYHNNIKKKQELLTIMEDYIDKFEKDMDYENLDIFSSFDDEGGLPS